MTTLASVLAELQAKGKPSTLSTYTRHGIAADRAYGVSVADMKVIAKGLKGRKDIATELLGTGWMEPMYLGGMVLDGRDASVTQLESWLDKCGDLRMVAEYTIPWLAVENGDAMQMALRWIDSTQDHVAAAGWNTLSGLVATRKDSDLDLELVRRLLGYVVGHIHTARNRTRGCMNNFVISVGSYVLPLVDEAKATARAIGKVQVDVGDTDCKIPDAVAYIEKVEAMGRSGKKRKTMRC